TRTPETQRGLYRGGWALRGNPPSHILGTEPIPFPGSRRAAGMSDQAQPQKRGGWLKAAVVGMLGLGGGAAGTYGTALIDRVAKPTRPVANFALAADGLSVTCQNRASGESGWWDFGDGTALE